MYFQYFINQNLIFLGPRRSSIESSGGSHGGISLPKLYQNKHLFLGKDKKAKLQEEKIPDQITSRRICKFYCILNPLKLPI